MSLFSKQNLVKAGILIAIILIITIYFLYINTNESNFVNVDLSKHRVFALPVQMTDTK